MISELPRSTMTKPLTCSEITFAAARSVVVVEAKAGTARDTAVAPPRTVKNSRRFKRFISDSFFGFFVCYFFKGGVLVLDAEPTYSRRRKTTGRTFKKS